jgi:hypothetical protein
VRLVSETVRVQRPVRAGPAVPRVHQAILRTRQQEARAAEFGQLVARHEQRGRRRKQFHSLGRFESAKKSSFASNCFHGVMFQVRLAKF